MSELREASPNELSEPPKTPIQMINEVLDGNIYPIPREGYIDLSVRDIPRKSGGQKLGFYHPIQLRLYGKKIVVPPEHKNMFEPYIGKLEGLGFEVEMETE